MLQAGSFKVRFLMKSLEFSIGLILPAALCSWDQFSVYQKADIFTAICKPIV
jgi:hypothetical protein